MSDFNAPLTGAHRATLSVSEWLEVDGNAGGPRSEQAAFLAANDPDSLPAFIKGLIYGSTVPLWAMGIDLDDFDGIDWKQVREALLAE